MKVVIFDFDGTLVDSSSGILESLAGVFAACDLAPNRPLTLDLIGPPVSESLAGLFDNAETALLERLASAFKAHYDTEGYRQTRPCEGGPRCWSNLPTSD